MTGGTSLPAVSRLRIARLAQASPDERLLRRRPLGAVGLLLFAASLQLFAFAPPSGADEQKQRVLFLNSYHRGYKWSDDILDSFEKELRGRGNFVELFVEYLDARRFPLDQKASAEALRAKYERTRIDAIAASDDDALALLVTQRERLFPTTPVVFCGVRYPHELLPPDSRRFTGVTEDLSVRETVRLITRFHPQVRKLFVVTDNSTAGVSQNREVRAALDGWPGLELSYLDGRELSMDELLARVRTLPADAALLPITWLRDRTGETFEHDDSYRRVCAASPVPVYGTGDVLLGRGIVGGRLSAGSAQGRVVARMVESILAGRSPEAIPIVREGQNEFMFDFRELRRWGIPLSALPERSLVVNRPESFYELHRTVIWVSLGIILVQAATIGALAQAIRRRHRTERALRESQEMYRALVETAPDGVMLVNSEGRIEYASPRAIEIHGARRADEVEGRNLLDLVHPAERALAETGLDGVFEDGGVRHSELKFLKGDGDQFDAELSVGPIPGPDGATRAAMVTIADITERKRLQAQLYRSQRLESLGTLSGGVAHDLNNILTPILLSIDRLRQRVGSDADLKILASLEAGAQRGAAIVRQLLTFARGAKGGEQGIDLRPVVREIEGIAHATFPKAIELRLDVPADVWTVTGDVTQLHQVLLNLCLNARDAMTAGGCLEIRARNVVVSDDRARRHLDVRPGPFVELTVSDTGCGIPKPYLDRIFDPFFTTKEEGKGTGLGLPTVLKIVKGHGGFVDVESEPGRGSLFAVFLPAEPARAAGSTGDGADAGRGEPGQGELVLVIDDEASVREVTCEILSEGGYRSIAASDGEAGVAAFRASAGEIGVVVTDIVMPGLDGLGVVSEIRKIDPAARIVAVTGQIDHPAVRELQRLSISRFLAKPYSAETLLRSIRDALERAAPEA
jgi:two-component system, cell cycle sensor histidine kinase and response regulator CckA